MSVFKSVDEFKEVLDRTFQGVSEESGMGAHATQRFAFTDLDVVVNLKTGADHDRNLAWEWSDDVSWVPTVRMEMSSDTANRYFQGKENVALAIARRRIRAAGDVKAALRNVQLTRRLFARYRQLVAADYPHLEV